MRSLSRNTGFLAGVLLAAAAVGALPAQSRADRAMLAAWNDSLQQVTSPDGLDAVEPLAHADGEASALRMDLFRLRSALLRDSRKDLELALSNLSWDASNHGDWPWPTFAMATAFAKLQLDRAPVLGSGGQRPGESHEEAAWRNLLESLTSDPNFQPARSFAIQLLVAGGDRELRGSQKKILAVLAHRTRPEADLLLVEGRYARAVGDNDRALQDFTRALDAGGDRARLQLERARTLLALGDSTSATASYWDGVEHLSPAGREAYRVDLAWILDPDSLASFDKVAASAVPAWLHRFWDERDAAAANHPGERLIEHLRRWDFAFAHYKVFVPWRHTQFTRIEYGFEGIDPCVKSDHELYDMLAREQPSYAGDIRAREPLLDHRGLIYLHHGAPFRTVRGPGHPFEVDTTGFVSSAVDPTLAMLADPVGPQPGSGVGSVPPDNSDLSLAGADLGTSKITAELDAASMQENDAWLYWIDGSWRVLNFRGSQALGTYAPTTLTSYLPVRPATLGAWLARASLLPEYAAAGQRLLQWSYGRQVERPSCLPQVTTVIAINRDDAKVATETDSDTPPIISPWDNVVRMFALGAAESHPGEVLLTFAFGGKRLIHDSLPDGLIDYPVSFRVVAYNHATGETVTIDTLREFVRAGALKEGQSLAALFDIPLAPGNWQVAVRANQGDDSSGVYAMSRSLRVDPAATFSLSDIVLGRDSTLAWRAPDGALFPVNTLGAYYTGATAELYYQVHGLDAGESYTTTVQVRQMAEGAKDGIRITSTDHATGAVTHVRKSLGLSQLGPGRYRLIITVEAANGRRDSREQYLLIEKQPARH